MDQQKAIKYVAAHGRGMPFATPQRDGSVYIYSHATYRDADGQVQLTVVRDRATTGAEVRRILGY